MPKIDDKPISKDEWLKKQKKKPKEPSDAYEKLARKIIGR